MRVPTKLGLLYPGFAAEDDLPWLVDALAADGSVVADVVHTSIDDDVHTVEVLRDMGSDVRLRAGAATLREHGVAVGVWVCTSASFVYGWDGARRQAEALASWLGAPASSTSLAFVHALRELGLERVALAATYPEPVTRCFVDMLRDAGIDVVASGSHDIPTATAAGALERDAVLALVSAGGDRRDAQAVLVPDTALHTVRWLGELEAAAGKPVLTANQVSVWEALRLAGRPVRADGLGALFAQPVAGEPAERA
jgi:maleate cis-trans isomerase